MAKFVGLFTFLICIALMASSCVSGQEQEECTRPRDVIKNSECSTCKKHSIPTDTCFEADHCHWCCECPPGTYVAKNCISLNDRDPKSTICEPCDPGFHTSTNNNATSCTKSKSEDFCERLQYTKFVKGSLEKDGRCECVTGTYSSDPEIGGCKKHTPCAKGFGVKIPGNETHDVQCEYCPGGMCSDEESPTQKCQICGEPDDNNGTSPTPPSTTNGTLASMTETPSCEPVPACLTDQGASPAWVYFLIVLGSVLVGAVLGIVVLVRYQMYRKKKKKKGNKVSYKKGGPKPEGKKRGGKQAKDEGSDDNSASDGEVSRNNSRKRLIREAGDSQVEVHEKLSEKEPMLKNKLNEDHVEIVDLPPQRNGDGPRSILPPRKKEEKGPGKEFPNEKTVELPPQELSETPEPPSNGPPPISPLMKQEEPVKERPTEKAVELPSSVLSETPEPPSSGPPPSPRKKEENGPVKELPNETPAPPLVERKTGKLTQDQYTHIFAHSGYRIIFNPNLDGNCQFSAITFLLDGLSEGLNEKAKDLRRTVVEYMKTNPDRFVSWNVGDWDTYIANMSKNSEYGDNLTLQAASDILQKTFKIVQTSNQGKPLVIAPRQLQDEILLGHVDEKHGMHYVCLALRAPKEASPCAQTPLQLLSDSRVEQDSKFQYDEIPPLRQLESPNSEVQNGTFSPLENLPALEQRQEQVPPPSQQQPSPAALPLPIENGPYVQQQNNVSNGIAEHLELFVNDQDKATLTQVPAGLLQNALDSKEYLHQMLLGPYGLHKDTSTQDLKDLIRQNRLIGNETDIEDIENENAKSHKEMRTKLLQKAQQEQGKKLTPRKILKLTVDHRPRKIYDDLCIAFIQYMQQNVNAGES